MHSRCFPLPPSYVLTAILAISASSAPAASQKAHKGIVKFPPPETEIRAPFALHAPSRQAGSIAFRAEDSMTAPDRQAAAGAMPAIRKSAALAGFDLDHGRWTYQQIVCPVFPNHVLLLFSRNNGAGDVSEFSAAVPRNTEDAARILPILRRSYALFPPAPANGLAISVFNWIRAGENPRKKAPWLTTALCYAALTGTRVVLPEPAGKNTKAGVPLAMSPLLNVGADGSAVIRFDDVEAPQHPKEWDLAFNSDGELLRVTVTPVPALRVTPLP